MIITTQAELTMLKKGQAREITIPKGRPRPGATKPRCRWTVGRDYTVTARATHTPDGDIDQGERSIRCLVLSITDTPDAWTLALTARALAEPTIYLARNPGAQLTDYVLAPSNAMHDEAEVIGESYERVVARMGRQEHARRVNHDQAAAHLEAAIRQLEQHATVSERGQLQRMKKQLAKLARGSVRDAA